MTIPPNPTTIERWKDHATPAPVLPEMVSLGPVWKQVTPNIPHRRGPRWQVRAAAMRVGRKMPELRKEWLRAFKQHCYLMMRILKIRRLDQNWQPDFEEWAKKTSYTLARIAELRKKSEASRAWKAQDRSKYATLVKSFIKLETYMARKWPRGIMSRSDFIKVWIGPLIKEFEQLLYYNPLTGEGCPNFIKHVPEGIERSVHKTKILTKEGRIYGETDFTSFESLLPQIQHVCEFALFRYMSGENLVAREMVDEFEGMCCGLNKMIYKDVTVEVNGHRMSGEMTTSIGNGWTNFMLLTFMSRKVHDFSVDCPFIIEGDDGLIGESPEYRSLYAPDNFANLGFRIKIDWYQTISDASFCGVTYDPVDGINVTDPLEKLAGFGWSLGQAVYCGNERRKELLIAKAYSMAYQYPGCPIIHELPKLVFRILGTKVNWSHVLQFTSFDLFQRERLLKAKDMALLEKLQAKPTFVTRLLVQRHYGVSVSEQLEIERYLRSRVTLDELDIPVNPAWGLDMTVLESRYKKSFKAGTSWASIMTAFVRYE
jgi:hypothetical protein